MSHTLKVRFYHKIPKRYEKLLLSKFVNPYGELHPAATNGKIVQVAIAKGKYNKVLGWCAVYKSIRDYEPIYEKDYSLGIFVNPKYRHRGVGSKLRRKAILWCLREKKKVWYFQDGHIATLATKEGMQYIDKVIKKENKTESITVILPKSIPIEDYILPIPLPDKVERYSLLRSLAGIIQKINWQY